MGYVIGVDRRRHRPDRSVSVDQPDRADGGGARLEAVRPEEAEGRQPDRLPRRGRLPGRVAHARSAVQALADLRREEVPVGAGARGPDRGRDRAGGRTAADRCQERLLQARVRELLEPRHVHEQRRPEGCATAGPAAGHAAADPPGRVRRAHLGPGLRPAGVARARAPRRAPPAACSSPRHSDSPRSSSRSS